MARSTILIQLKKIARKEGTSRRQIFRYIRLNDQEGIAFNPAVELSYLSKRQQDILLEAINDLDATPSVFSSSVFKAIS